MPVESLWLYVLLFAAGVIAGGIDSIAGGGGLITIPVLLSIGMPPQMVLGTNKLQASFGSFTAAAYYVRHGVVDVRDAFPGIAWTFIGAAFGTWAVQQIDPALLDYVIPFLLLAIALYMLVARSPGNIDQQARFSRTSFYLCCGTALGFYDGFFGPGVGAFWAMAFILGLGFNLTKATGYTKVMNFTSNIVSCVLFLAGGHVLFVAGGVMGVGQIIGARIGSRLVIRKGAALIRPIFISVVILTTLKLIYHRLTP